MLCRALIAAVAVTYLMCVFLLSGIQKEDLDVSMLTKLQRHNVNIDDMNNEELIQACVQSRNNINIERVKNITRAQPFISKLKNAGSDDFKSNVDLGNMLKRPRNLENSFYNTSTDYKVSHEFNENNNKASKKIAYENQPNVDEVTQYSDSQAKLESALKYLQDMRMNKAPTPQPVSIKEQESKRSITDDLHSSETETLRRMIANFMSKRKSMSTKPTTTQKTLNIEDLYETLYTMQKQDMEKISNFNSGFQLPIQQNGRMTPVGKEIIENKSERKMDKNTQNRSNFTDALTLLNTYKSFNPFIPDDEILSKLNGKAKESLKLSSNLNLNRFERPETVGTTSTNVEPKHELSRDMIKEIADSVKELILRDLRKELLETTTLNNTTTIKSTTTIQSTTTTDSTIKTTPKKVSTKPEESVMNKFLELFEEIKSLKSSMVITNKNEKGINDKETGQNVDMKELKGYSPIAMTARIPNNIIQSKLPFYDNQVYGIQQHLTNNSENFFNFAPQVHKYRSNGTFKKQEPKELSKGLLPITVQTNNIEVPPLGIPLDKPQDLIGQNIIITTAVPYRIIPINNGPIKKRNQHRGTPPHSEEDGSFKTYKYKSKQVHPPPLKGSFKSPSHQFDSNSKDDVIRLTLNNNENSKYNADYYEKIHIGKYKPRPDSGEIKYREIPRFHQKLEKVERYLDNPEQDMYIDKNDCCNKKYRYSQAMVDCCNRKIASRHRMSFNNMKKKSYDDTHFRNFMQSQQKVTDMLEKILGDKRNVQSVETA